MRELPVKNHGVVDLVGQLIVPISWHQMGYADKFGNTPSVAQDQLKKNLDQFNVELSEIVGEFLEEFSDTARDPKLSEVGRQDARAKMSAKYFARIDAVQGHAEKYAARGVAILAEVNAAEAALFPQVGDAATEIRAVEIRNLFRGMTSTEVIAAYQKADQDARWEIVAAADRAPWRLLPSDVQERIIQDRRERLWPAEMADAYSFERCAEWVSGACSVAQTRLTR